MGLLQDPQKALEQIEWYLDNAGLEVFPGAFEISAGSLCRQTLEQILFLMCFFSGMPHRKYMKADRTLRPAGNMLSALKNPDPRTGQTYFELARKAGPRIRKLARQPRSLERWRRELNETAHFTARNRCVDEERLRDFVRFARSCLDKNDKYAVVAAINEIFSDTYKAVLGGGPDNMPGITRKCVIGPGSFQLDEEGRLTLKTPTFPLKIISSNEVPRGRREE